MLRIWSDPRGAVNVTALQLVPRKTVVSPIKRQQRQRQIPQQRHRPVLPVQEINHNFLPQMFLGHVLWEVYKVIVLREVYTEVNYSRLMMNHK